MKYLLKKENRYLTCNFNGTENVPSFSAPTPASAYTFDPAQAKKLQSQLGGDIVPQHHSELFELLARITPLDTWATDRRRTTEDTHNWFITAIARDDGRAVDVARIYPISDDGQEGGESCANVEYLLHCARQLPKLLEAVEAFEAEVARHFNDDRPVDIQVWNQLHNAIADTHNA